MFHKGKHPMVCGQIIICDCKYHLMLPLEKQQFNFYYIYQIAWRKWSDWINKIGKWVALNTTLYVRVCVCVHWYGISCNIASFHKDPLAHKYTSVYQSEWPQSTGDNTQPLYPTLCQPCSVPRCLYLPQWTHLKM